MFVSYTLTLGYIQELDERVRDELSTDETIVIINVIKIIDFHSIESFTDLSESKLGCEIQFVDDVDLEDIYWNSTHGR